ncbi:MULTISPECIES: transporter substrate-binding domain-containing protein [Kitasatospora]|uniref:transporter substrate-binding domain-containing protein n=1 Tax=Kitasatospora TaxID=2063 RepID=UPI000C70B80B|nr:transporter substrate-binding domain-containing protein [Kitasatospora sp. GP30]MDH6141189.1 polar amino acid transport system substrate-binding protein [Kitasatospora sp. GP30]
MRLHTATGLLALTGTVLAALMTAGPASPRTVATAGSAAAPGQALAAGAQTAANPNDPHCKASPFQPHEDPTGPTIKAIQAKGSVTVGVDLNDYHWGFLGPDGQPAGFDVDIARAIAQSLPGNPKINWVGLDDDQRIPRLNATGDQHVDFVVHTMTINCDRRAQVAMSTVYFEAGQRVLVPSPQAHAGEQGPDAMKGKRVCTATNSTASDLLTADSKLPQGSQQYRVAQPLVTADSELDCLVKLQLGQADAILTDDAIAYGLAAQDPQTAVVGDQLTDEPYGIATALGEGDLASWINQALEAYRTNGSWQTSYNKWIKPYVPGQAEIAPPPAQYTN